MVVLKVKVIIFESMREQVHVLLALLTQFHNLLASYLVGTNCLSINVVIYKLLLGLNLNC